MASTGDGKKPARVYNRDRMARIKEAARERGDIKEELREDDLGHCSDEEGRRTPVFLRVKEAAPAITGSRRLSVGELTSCTTDSSQLATLMGGVPLKEELISDNRLEQSRKNKITEREEINRKVAESLDKASEKWHSHMKGLDRNVSTLDSRGIKMSLFNEDTDLLEKFEKENAEKNIGNKKYGTDFSGRLDILLQRGLRTPWLSKSSTNLRSINERSHNRWSNKLDRFSSVWDLKYSLLHNRINSKVPKNHYTPSISSEFIGKCDSLNISNKYSPYTNPSFQPFNQVSGYSQPSLDYSSNSVYKVHPQQKYPTGLQQSPNQPIQQYAQMNPNLTFVGDQSYLQNIQYRPLDSTQFQIPQPNWFQQNQQIPYPQYYQNNLSIPPVNYSQNQAITNPTNSSHNLKHNASYRNYESENFDLSNSFESISQKITDLTEKLDKLNFVVNDLTINQSSTNIKPIIKKHDSIKYDYGKETNLSNVVSINERNINKSQENEMPYGNKKKYCNALRTVSSNDRRVKFESPEIFKDEENVTLDRMNAISKSNDSSIVKSSKNMAYGGIESVHPNSVNKRFNENYQNSKTFKTFVLPPEASSVIMYQTKRNIHKYFREGK